MKREARPTFRDPRVADAYERAGFVVVPFLEPGAVATLAAAYGALSDAVHAQPFSASVMSADAAYRRGVDAAIGAAFAEPLARLLADYRFGFGSFVVKRPASAGSLPIHQDPQFTDEPAYEAVNIWVPLVDVSPANGCLRVMPGSHRLNRGPRGTQRGFPYPALAEAIARDFCVDVPMRAGEACVTSHRTFHGSERNATLATRVTAAAIAVPVGAPMRYFYQGGTTPRGTIDVYDVDDDFFRTRVFGEPVRDRAPIARIAATVDPLTYERAAAAFADARETVDA